MASPSEVRGFQPDDTRLQKHYFYGDGSNGRKDLQQVTHRLFKSDATDQNGVYSDFEDNGKSGVNRCRRFECSLESKPMTGAASSWTYD